MGTTSLEAKRLERKAVYKWQVYYTLILTIIILESLIHKHYFWLRYRDIDMKLVITVENKYQRSLNAVCSMKSGSVQLSLIQTYTNTSTETNQRWIQYWSHFNGVTDVFRWEWIPSGSEDCEHTKRQKDTFINSFVGCVCIIRQFPFTITA